MRTYDDEVRRHEALVRRMLRHGLVPAGSDLERLLYFTGRARTLGGRHPLGMIDHVVILGFLVKRAVGSALDLVFGSLRMPSSQARHLSRVLSAGALNAHDPRLPDRTRRN